MPRQGKGQSRDGVCDFPADPVTFFCFRSFRTIPDGLAEVDAFQPGRGVHGNKTDSDSGPAVIHSGQIREVLLKKTENIVPGIVTFP